MTVSLCTSRPAHRSMKTSILPPSSDRRWSVARRSLISRSLWFVLEATVVGSRGSRVPLRDGLTAPSRSDVAGRPLIFTGCGWPCARAMTTQRMSLDRATGRVIRRDELEERPTLVMEADGLREGEDVVFQMQVDVATGVVLQIPRGDLDLVLRVEGFRVGGTEQP